MTEFGNLTMYCVGCGTSREFVPFRRIDDINAVIRCPECKCVKILSPAKNQDDANTNYVHRIEQEEDFVRVANHFFQWVLRRYNIQGKVLDVGCSVGHFVKVGQEIGLNIEGIDIDSKAVEHGHKLGLPLTVGTLEKVSGSYGMILCNHVLEHIEEPDDFVCRARDLLDVGGYFVAVMPYYMGYDATYLCRDRWTTASSKR